MAEDRRVLGGRFLLDGHFSTSIGVVRKELFNVGSLLSGAKDSNMVRTSVREVVPPVTEST